MTASDDMHYSALECITVQRHQNATTRITSSPTLKSATRSAMNHILTAGACLLRAAFLNIGQTAQSLLVVLLFCRRSRSLRSPITACHICISSYTLSVVKVYIFRREGRR